MKQFLSHLQTDAGKEEIKNSYVRTAIKMKSGHTAIADEEKIGFTNDIFKNS